MAAPRRPPRTRSALGFHAKYQITLGEGTRFGDGKAELLTLIDGLGSLRQAAGRMDMSYRHAWGLLRDLEKAAGFAFLEHETDARRSRLQLTAEARRFLDAWRAFRAPLDAAVERRFLRVFGRG